MEFEIGQKLTKDNYTPAAIWCASHQCSIEKRADGYYIVPAKVVPLPLPSQREQVLAQLTVIDAKTIRALRAMSAGVGKQEDKNQLEMLETQAAGLRAQLKQLQQDEAAV